MVPIGFPVANYPWSYPAIDEDDLSGDNIKVEGLDAGVEFKDKGSFDSNKHILNKLKKLQAMWVADNINFDPFIWQMKFLSLEIILLDGPIQVCDVIRIVVINKQCQFGCNEVLIPIYSAKDSCLGKVIIVVLE